MLKIRIVSSVLLIATPSCAQVAPRVYWWSSPVAVNESTSFAGGFGPTPSVRLCANSSVDCSTWTPVALLDGWDHGVKFVMPLCASPGCRFQFCSSVNGPCIDVADPNSPDIWFTMASPPLVGTSFSPGPTDGPTLVNGPGGVRHSILRVYGRSVAFAPGPNGLLSCIPATSRQEVETTTLTLSADVQPVSALNATCFEATFDLESALTLAGVGPFPDAVVTTPFGTFSVPIAVVPVPPSAGLTVIDVDADADGNVTAALAQVGGPLLYSEVEMSTPFVYPLCVCSFRL
jgi:hypothetical protein